MIRRAVKNWLRNLAIRLTGRTIPLGSYLCLLLAGALASLIPDWRSTSTLWGLAVGFVAALAICLPTMDALRAVIDERTNNGLDLNTQRIPKAVSKSRNRIGIFVDVAVLVPGTLLFLWFLFVRLFG